MLVTKTQRIFCETGTQFYIFVW